MKLIRFATICLSFPAPTQLGRWTYETADKTVTVEVMGIHGSKDTTQDEIAQSIDGQTISWSFYNHTRRRSGVVCWVA